MKRVSLLALFFVFVFSGISMARDSGFGREGRGGGKEGMGMPHGKWWKMPQAADKLGLTQEEKEKLDEMYLEHRRQRVDLHAQIEKQRLELEELLDGKTFDAKGCMERFKKVQEVQNGLAEERFRFLVQVRELLGLERYQQLKNEFRRHRMKGKQDRQKPETEKEPPG